MLNSIRGPVRSGLVPVFSRSSNVMNATNSVLQRIVESNLSYSVAAHVRPTEPVVNSDKNEKMPDTPITKMPVTSSPDKNQQEDGSQSRITLKCPRGTRDYGPRAMAIREKVLDVVVECFKRHGAQTIDTPVFETKEILLGKYGEEGGKLVYDLDDQGGEKLTMRYDLTVPFARYLAMNRVTNIKRYHIAKVYRRDNPRMTRGRYREFLQCDFDIAGQYDPMLPEVECLRIVDEILGALQLGEYFIKINHRRLLDAMFTVCGIKKSKFKSVCSSVDKLDKADWQTVRHEIVNEKRVPPASADKLEPILMIREHEPSMTNEQAIDKLLTTPVGKDKQGRKALEELHLLLHYCELLGLKERIRFEPSLARGLDYYTGAIYEAVVTEFSASSELAPADEQTGDEEGDTAQGGVGSVAGGGRYDELVGMFMSKGQDVPCVGVSIGVERLFAIMQMKADQEEQSIRTVDTEVYVASAQKKMTDERLRLATALWDAGIKAEVPYRVNPRMLDQLQYCEGNGVPFALIIGDGELQRNVVKIREITTRDEVEVPRSEMISELKERIEKWKRGN